VRFDDREAPHWTGARDEEQQPDAYDRHFRSRRDLCRSEPACDRRGDDRQGCRAGAGYPDVSQNTAAFVHELPAAAIANVDGDGSYVRVQVLTNCGALDRDKQIAVVRQLTELVAKAAGDPSLTKRTWVLLTEAPDGGWGLWGHAQTNEEIVVAARAQMAGLRASTA
jgi:phenylpyruvate tautomerase PptA (4-oxalocrotonate tautomerase family)